MALGEEGEEVGGGPCLGEVGDGVFEDGSHGSPPFGCGDHVGSEVGSEVEVVLWWVVEVGRCDGWGWLLLVADLPCCMDLDGFAQGGGGGCVDVVDPICVPVGDVAGWDGVWWVWGGWYGGEWVLE